jgi:hypothetical protein
VDEVGLGVVAVAVAGGGKYFHTTVAKWVRGKMVADVVGEFDGIGHATRAKAWIGIGWPSDSPFSLSFHQR